MLFDYMKRQNGATKTFVQFCLTEDDLFGVLGLDFIGLCFERAP